MNRRASCGEVRESGGKLALGENIRPHNPARNGSLGNPVDLESVLIRPLPLVSLDFVDKGNTERKLTSPGQFPDESPLIRGETAPEIHNPNLDIMSNAVNTRRTRHFVEPWNDSGMSDIWEKRGVFKEWVAEAKAKLGATNNADVAPILGLTPSSLNKYLGKSDTHKPSAEALKLLGDFLGKDYRLLLEGPGAAPPGISEEDWLKVTDRTRVLASAMFEDLKSFPPEEQEAYYQLWLQGVRIGRARMMAEKQEKKPEGKKGGKKP
jgi:hypothetical protein